MQDKTIRQNAADTDSKKSSLRDKAGDMLEKVGHKVSNAGHEKLGQKIHDLGDSIEKGHKNPSHPHKV